MYVLQCFIDYNSANRYPVPDLVFLKSHCGQCDIIDYNSTNRYPVPDLVFLKSHCEQHQPMAFRGLKLYYFLQ